MLFAHLKADNQFSPSQWIAVSFAGTHSPHGGKGKHLEMPRGAVTSLGNSDGNQLISKRKARLSKKLSQLFIGCCAPEEST